MSENAANLSQREKMLAGLAYLPDDPELCQLRDETHDLCLEYNQLPAAADVRRQQILQTLLGGIGERVFFRAPLYCDYGKNTYIGNNFYANFNLVILDCAKVTIGDDVLIGPNCSLYTAVHPLDFAQRCGSDPIEYAQPITIGNGVWLGGNVTVLPGVSIGEHSVIGAGSVVVKSIPANCVAAGNPCRVIKKLPTDAE